MGAFVQRRQLFGKGGILGIIQLCQFLRRQASLRRIHSSKGSLNRFLGFSGDALRQGVDLGLDSGNPGFGFTSFAILRVVAVGAFVQRRQLFGKGGILGIIQLCQFLRRQASLRRIHSSKGSLNRFLGFSGDALRQGVDLGLDSGNPGFGFTSFASRRVVAVGAFVQRCQLFGKGGIPGHIQLALFRFVQGRLRRIHFGKGSLGRFLGFGGDALWQGVDLGLDLRYSGFGFAGFASRRVVAVGAFIQLCFQRRQLFSQGGIPVHLQLSLFCFVQAILRRIHFGKGSLGRFLGFGGNFLRQGVDLGLNSSNPGFGSTGLTASQGIAVAAGFRCFSSTIPNIFHANLATTGYIAINALIFAGANRSFGGFRHLGLAAFLADKHTGLAFCRFPIAAAFIMLVGAVTGLPIAAGAVGAGMGTGCRLLIAAELVMAVITIRAGKIGTGAVTAGMDAAFAVLPAFFGMDMVTLHLRGVAAIAVPAGMIAVYRFPVAAGAVMLVGTGRRLLIAAEGVMLMGAGTSRDRRGVAALACMEGMVLAKAVRFLRKRKNWDVPENQEHRKQTAQRPFPKQRLHIGSSYVTMV